jgi:hypothetical protein
MTSGANAVFGFQISARGFMMVDLGYSANREF